MIKITNKKDRNNNDIVMLSCGRNSVTGYTPRDFAVAFYDIDGIQICKKMTQQEISKIPEYFIKKLRQTGFCNSLHNGFYLYIELSISFFDNNFIKKTKKDDVEGSPFVFSESIFDIGFISQKIEKLDIKKYKKTLEEKIREEEEEIQKKEYVEEFYKNVEFRVKISSEHGCHHHDQSCPHNNDYPWNEICKKKSFFIRTIFLSEYCEKEPILAENMNYNFYSILQRNEKVIDFYKKSCEEYKKTGTFLESPLFKGICTKNASSNRMKTDTRSAKEHSARYTNTLSMLIEGKLHPYFSEENKNIKRQKATSQF